MKPLKMMQTKKKLEGKIEEFEQHFTDIIQKIADAERKVDLLKRKEIKDQKDEVPLPVKQ